MGNGDFHFWATVISAGRAFRSLSRVLLIAAFISLKFAPFNLS